MSDLQKWVKKKLQKQIYTLLENTTVRSHSLDFVDVQSNDKNFFLVGCGCSSAVFRSKDFPGIAVKVYSKAYREEVMEETMAYKKVRGLHYFPKLYLYGNNFLAIEFIEGKSLYECLIEGIEISDEVMNQVDEAIILARERGLIPSDIHFKNVILTNNGIRLVDLSDYLAAEHVSRWDRLKFFYKAVYKPFLKGTRIPKKVVDFARKLFKLIENTLERLIELVKRV